MMSVLASHLGRALLVLGIAVAVLLVVSANASASPPPTPWQTLRDGTATQEEVSSFLDELEDWHNNPDLAFVATTGSATSRRAVLSRLAQGRIAARLAPRLLGGATGASLVFLAGSYVWQWKQDRDRDGVIDKIHTIFLDSDTLGRNALANPMLTAVYAGGNWVNYSYTKAQWRPLTASYPGWDSYNDRCPPQYQLDPVTGVRCWRLEIEVRYDGYADKYYPQGSTTWGSGNIPEEYVPSYERCVELNNAPTCWWSDPFSASWEVRGTRHLAWLTHQQIAATGRGDLLQLPWPDKAGGNNYPDVWYMTFRGSMDGLVAPTDELITDGTGSHPPPTIDSGTYTVPADAGNATDVSHALDAFDAVCGRALINHIRAPLNYAYPADCDDDPPAEEPAGVFDWEMPDCRGLSVESCQAEINLAATSSNAAEPSYVVETASAETTDPAVADALAIGTYPAVSTSGQPTTVTITQNPSGTGNDPGCVSTTENPHWSVDGATVLAKGRVTCNYAGTTEVSMTLWRCTDGPDADESRLLSGDWGCQPAATTQRVIGVVPGAPVTVYCPDIGSVPVPGGAYFIASTLVTGAPASWSQPTWYVEEP